ncbi:CHAD domain-containing protein [Methylococcus geothermalis]|uniref:CHAD domain-containing protein n=1 Tax=Methylococcus geothermalis TaxID=2681310 RepID=A0A858QBX0_9GAMM|nr:CHAD domain-containing protein [Methylococcus geothermalis]
MQETEGDTGRAGVEPTAACRADVAVRRFIAQFLERMLSCEAGILENRDPEALHEYRVALRRSRALLGEMKGVFPERDTVRCLHRLKWLGALTGPLRDCHVMLGEFPVYEAAVPESLRPALAPLRSHLEQEAARAHRVLADRLRRPAYRRTIESWRRFLERPAPKRPSAPNARAPAGVVCGRRIWKLYRRMLRDAAALGPDSPQEAFHALRKQGKKLRYLLEFSASLQADGKIRGLIAQLKKLQDVLGEFQDASVQRARLLTLAELMRQEGQPVEALLAVGVLVGSMEQRQSRCRGAFRESWEAFGGKPTRRRFRRLFGPGDGEGDRDRRGV